MAIDYERFNLALTIQFDATGAPVRLTLGAEDRAEIDATNTYRLGQSASEDYANLSGGDQTTVDDVVAIMAALLPALPADVP